MAGAVLKFMENFVYNLSLGRSGVCFWVNLGTWFGVWILVSFGERLTLDQKWPNSKPWKCEQVACSTMCPAKYITVMCVWLVSVMEIKELTESESYVRILVKSWEVE